MVSKAETRIEQRPVDRLVFYARNPCKNDAAVDRTCIHSSCIWRWVQIYGPELDKRCRAHLKRTNKSYRVDETSGSKGGPIFVGDEQAMPLHVGVIANGHGLVLEHDVFYNVRNAVVFWGAEGGTSHRNAMRNCLVYGASTSGIWTVETDGDDFDFRNNVIANSRIVWMRERGGTRRYKAVASVFTDNANMAAYGAGAAGSITLTDSTFLSLQEMRLAGRVDLVMDRSERNYLHIRKGSAGSEVKAGLFTQD
jgi:hypothetical protein